jgi:hypothetical protein
MYTGFAVVSVAVTETRKLAADQTDQRISIALALFNHMDKAPLEVLQDDRCYVCCSR